MVELQEKTNENSSERMMDMSRIMKRPVIRILPILLFFVIRSRAFADLAWEPAPGPETADVKLQRLIRIIFICVIALVWFYAKARMLKRYDRYRSGWRVVIPFHGRYLEYKYYWDTKYYWICFGVLFLGFVLAGKAVHVMYVPLLVWGGITVRMRMKTMEAFGHNKFLGLLELLGLCIVLDCICAFSGKRLEEERALKAEPVKTESGQSLSPIGLIKSKIPTWIWIMLVLLLSISELLLHQYNEKNQKIWVRQTAQAVTEQVQTAVAVTQTNAAEITKTPNPFGHYVGDIISFGTYEQDQQSGADPIEWQVLAIENGRALLLSRYGLAAKMFHHEPADITWEDSDLRTWLNGSFYNSSFTSAEKAVIQKVPSSDPCGPDHTTEDENDAQDHIFLLSIEEAEKYLLTDSSRQCEAAYLAQQNGAQVNSDGYSLWWLRSPGRGGKSTAYVFTDGDFSRRGSFVNNDFLTVRPALWLSF